jgi:hypothetical protein
MFKETDTTAEAKRYRMAQMIENNGIEGAATDPALVVIIERGAAEGLSQDEIAARVIAQIEAEQGEQE